MITHSPFDASALEAGTRPGAVHPLVTNEAREGLLSGPAIYEQLVQAWQRARTLQKPLSIMFLRGLHRGDLGPAQHTIACLAQLHSGARVGVYDRQALIAVLPDADAQQALQIARTLGVRLSGRGRIACGVAVYPEAAWTLPTLVGAAERASRRASAADAIVLARPASRVCAATSALAATAPAHLQPLAANDQLLLLIGEAGSGKEALAGQIHAASARGQGPFRSLQCAWLSEAELERALFGDAGQSDREECLLRAAQGGTLYLAGVAELTLEAQTVLLKALRESQDVRIIAGSEDDLEARCAEGRFHAELLGLLGSSRLQVRPLRDRASEIDALAEEFVAATCARWGAPAPRLLDETKVLLGKHLWAGNLDELSNVIERAVALAEDDTITPTELPEHVRFTLADAPERSAAHCGPILDLRASLLDHEAVMIRQALQLSGGNQRKAAGLLNLPLRTFERKLRNLGGRERLMAS